MGLLVFGFLLLYWGVNEVDRVLMRSFGFCLGITGFSDTSSEGIVAVSGGYLGVKKAGQNAQPNLITIFVII